MKKFLDHPLWVETVTVEEQPILRIRVLKPVLGDWCLSLQLLQDRLVEGFVFRQNRSLQKIEFRVNSTERTSIKVDEARVEVGFSLGDLDFLRHFFLRYYRDDVADVDHVDLETGSGGYVIFSVNDFHPPVSADEARRRLGMD